MYYIDVHEAELVIEDEYYPIYKLNDNFYVSVGTEKMFGIDYLKVIDAGTELSEALGEQKDLYADNINVVKDKVKSKLKLKKVR